MTVTTEWLLGILFALSFGSYGWTSILMFWYSSKFDMLYKQLINLRDNHIKHLNDRIDSLEKTIRDYHGMDD